MKEISGGEVLAAMLAKEGVDTVFGIIDGTYFGFYSSLKKYGIQLITPRHETSAAHMAGAYSRLTGRLGVCMASNGPGVANILPGLVVEEAEGNRILCVTSARRTGINHERTGGYQCFDQSGTIGRFAKWSGAVPSFDRIPELMRTALRRAYEGRPGVVHIDVPENIMNAKVKAEPAFQEPAQYRRTTPVAPNPDDIKNAAVLLLAAKRPMIHAGSGVIHAAAYEELKELSELLLSPVTTSWAARGVLSETSPLAIPMTHVTLNHAVRRSADLVLVLGSRIGETDWWGKAPYWAHPSRQKMIQVDVDDKTLGANKPAAVLAHSDVKLFLRELINVLRPDAAKLKTSEKKSLADSYEQQLKKFREKLDKALEDNAAPMNSAHVAHTAQKLVKDDAIFVLDGGNTAIWANFYLQMRTPGSMLSTYKFGMLGAGVAQTLGAAVALKDRQVICIIGDGAMGFHPQEIETAVRCGLKVIYLVLCDKQWGMVKMNQMFTLRPLKTLLFKSLGPEETINADLGEIRFDLLAESMGAKGERVSAPADLGPAIERALAADGPAVIHVDVNPVTHMWAPGLIHFKDMHKEPAGR